MAQGSKEVLGDVANLASRSNLVIGLTGPFGSGCSSMFKVLGDPTRLKIVMTLREMEMCVCDLAASLGLSESAVSHQLRRLRDLALVRRRRQGQILYYSLDDDHVLELLNTGIEHVKE